MAETSDLPGARSYGARRQWLLCLGVALALGVLAFLADHVPGVVGAILLGLASTGSAWGVPALVQGFFAPTLRTASLRGAGMLLVASAVYYLLIAFVSRRWAIGGSNLITGEVTADIGLRSLLRDWILWSIVALVVGAVLGVLGYSIRKSGGMQTSCFAGIAIGILIAEATYGIFLISTGYGLLENPERTIRLLIGLGIGLSAPVLLVSRSRSALRWIPFILSVFATTALGVLAWYVIDFLRYAI